MNTFKRSDLSGGIAVFALLAGSWTAPGFAAEEGDATATTRNVGETIDTIIVTATKREENIQDVPVAITAFSEEAMKDRGVQQARDLNAPNFVFPQMYTTSRSYISVRGIFQEVNNIGFDGGFSAYLDGVYLGRNMSYDVDMFSVERVEILRGPQGTLFGKNTIGGLMNVVSKRPSQEFEARKRAGGDRQHGPAAFQGQRQPAPRRRRAGDAPVRAEGEARRLRHQSHRRPGRRQHRRGQLSRADPVHADRALRDECQPRLSRVGQHRLHLRGHCVRVGGSAYTSRRARRGHRWCCSTTQPRN